MEWQVEYTDDFEAWWNTLSEVEQEDIDAKVRLLERFGPALARPHSDVISSSRHRDRYETYVPVADRRYDGPLEILRLEGLIDG